MSSTMAILCPASLLKSVDLPTFGRPIIPIFFIPIPILIYSSETVHPVRFITRSRQAEPAFAAHGATSYLYNPKFIILKILDTRSRRFETAFASHGATSYLYNPKFIVLKILDTRSRRSETAFAAHGATPSMELCIWVAHRQKVI
jgi:hypothetical protein